METSKKEGLGDRPHCTGWDSRLWFPNAKSREIFETLDQQISDLCVGSRNFC
jgi:hypothetical protein